MPLRIDDQEMMHHFVIHVRWLLVSNQWSHILPAWHHNKLIQLFAWPYRWAVFIKTHWGRVTHICIICSDNSLSPDRRLAIIWTNAGLLLIGPLGTNFSEILIKILTFSFNKMRLKVSYVKRRPFCLGLNLFVSASNFVSASLPWNIKGVRSMRCCCVICVRSARVFFLSPSSATKLHSLDQHNFPWITLNSTKTLYCIISINDARYLIP